MLEKKSSLIKLIGSLYRITQAYTDKALSKYHLSSGMYPFLLILKEKEGISQNEISKMLNIDKAMSARTVKKLIELDYIKKEEDKEDCRAYRLYLTDKARGIIPGIIDEIKTWIDILCIDSTEIEQEKSIEFLLKALKNAKKFNEKNETE